jgi:hypothetical protein
MTARFVIRWTMVSVVAETAAVTVAFFTLAASWNAILTVAVFEALLLGAAVGALMAVPQSVLLRRRIERSWLWIAARAAAWGCALPALFFAGFVSSRFSGANVSTVAALVLGSFAVIAAFVGIVEGYTLNRLTRQVCMQPDRGVAQAEAGNGRFAALRRTRTAS